jgi:hypothetical protein
MVIKDLLSPGDTVTTLYFGSIEEGEMQTWTLHKWKIGDSDDQEQEWWIFPRSAQVTETGDLRQWLTRHVDDAEADELINAASRQFPLRND